ncbi:flavoprotein [Clostridium luticellarii]|jgi:hypothetical protein|uniref:Flavoprotein n=1 Tax=Clostridium luticellarii TaxID=1691940 RepID=A0A2T0BPC7_9CLOT|nr:flavoprotein [Clostridium luticellarii]MCI1945020.1 flavoprotein [Clostridium luticellarii]MCI1967581.1 flavoprotein [Clostridium luticellarii]MCI1995721.1 flavoprotein [Clostridium luticellarii]MCI2040059.1 flavoprotein [Clostridium luticellarii]PRR85737.1 Flavoprotein [Clostridium luticellarii]
MDIKDLLRPVVAQIVSMLNKRVLLFISGGAVNIKDIFETLASMSILKYDIVMTEPAKKVIPEKYIDDLNGKFIECKEELTQAVREDDLVLVPVMTRNTLSKCAVGIEDNLVTIGIAEALMMNKKVIAVSDSFDPENPRNQCLGFSKNEAYNKFILNYKDTLCGLGVDFIQGDELRRTLESKFILLNNYNDNLSAGAVEEKKIFSGRDEDKNIIDAGLPESGKACKILSHVVTAKDILANIGNTKEILIKQGSLITPLAKDYMDNNNIVVRYY